MEVVKDTTNHKNGTHVPIRTAHDDVASQQVDRTNDAILGLVSSLAAQLVRTSEVMLLLRRSVEDGALANHHDSTRDSTSKPSPNVAHDQRVQNVTISIEDVESEGAAALRVPVDVALHQLHALHRVDDAELVHHLLAALEEQLPVRAAVLVLSVKRHTHAHFDVNTVRHAQHVEPVSLRLVAIDVGEVVLAYVLVLRLERVPAAQQSQDLALVLFGRRHRLVRRKGDLQFTTREKTNEDELDVILSVDEMATRK